MSVGDSTKLNLQGCTVLGVNGFPFAVGGKIDLAFGEHELHCVGDAQRASFSYTELAELKISGPGSVTKGGGFIGGGFGAEGAIEGIAIAGVLNLLTTRSKIHTFITLIANFGELHLHYGEMEPGALRMSLASVYVKLRRLDPAWLESRLKILTIQKEGGSLSEEGFTAARNRLLITSDWRDPIAEAKDLRLFRDANLKEAMESGPKGVCPNCDKLIPLHADSCPSCKAAFGVGSAWRVLPA